MSRHRDFRNLNIHDELDDDALSDGGGEEMTIDQQAQMNDGLEQVRLVIGDEVVSELSDDSIKDALWEYYFHIEKTVQWALEERERRQIAKEKKAGDLYEPSSFDLHGESASYQSNQPGQMRDDEDQDYPEPEVRSRLPSIFLAQQQPGFDNEAYLSVENSPQVNSRNRLSTITEHTEKTDPSVRWRSRQQYLMPNSARSLLSSPTTSYGQELDARMSMSERDHQPDPNIGPSSPSGSAMQRLSTYDPPPSNSSTITPNDPSHPLTSGDPIHSISKEASEQGSLRASEPDHTHAPKVGSKLSKLASSRASSVSTRSESSGSSGTFVTGSIKTFPALRPSAQSERPPSSVASSKELPAIPSPSSTPIPSAPSSIIQRAIQTALELEAVDREATPKPSRLQPQSEPSDRSKTPTPNYSHPANLPSNSETTPVSPTRPLSKLALLAQQKAEGGSRPSSVQRLSTPPQSSPSSRPLSKLAMLAQQKIDATRVPKLPKTSTEYLTPIANGPSVTTAITTSYQSLYSLTDPSRSNVIPKLNVVPLQLSVEASTPTDHRPSKLAMKIRRAGEKSSTAPEFPPEEQTMPSPPPLFQSKSTDARASPSAFASVLILDNIHNHQDKSTTKEGHGGHKRKKEKVSAGRIVRDGSTNSHPHHSHKSKHANSPSHDTEGPTPFAFDVPSPDDIVLNARKGSGLRDVVASPKPSAGAGKSSSKS
ncbi:hypothetical protein BYT27DRAFT_7108972 [Phlegmacium glaucopus]|nr:hypothetical protein BYT27DRAFT_7108972 [Phlegmacium glaucopus]